MGVILWGESPLYVVLESFKMSVYQMKFYRKTVRGEGNCGEATDRGEEACDRVRYAGFDYRHPDTISSRAARRRTETRYKADDYRRAGC